eukprot:COSAG02_NODE_16733_length_1060_cov_0.903226_1_plen_60_part_10
MVASGVYTGELRSLPATLLHDLMLVFGGYRPMVKNVFPRNDAGANVVADVATAVLMDNTF